jgi:hypothetical protein
MFNKLSAIEYLLMYGQRWSEWKEAGLLAAVEEIMDAPAQLLTQAYLDELIEIASRN